MALQMTWQPSLLHQKRKNGPPLGLKNFGNSCYLDSVLQCLTYTPPLANFCLKNQHSSSCDSAAEPERKRECPFCILEKRIVRSLRIDLTLDTPSKINNCLKIFAEHFRLGLQEDAHEFLRCVVDACHNTCLRLKKSQQLQRKGGNDGANEGFSGSTVVKEIFGGALQSQVKCLSCGAESNKVDEIMDINLDVLHSNFLKESLQKFFQAEVLDGKKNTSVRTRKQMSLLQASNVLVIQLKRFEEIFGRKIDKAIAFEEVLDPHPEYNLFGTIVHSGLSPDSGHYYAHIKDAMGCCYCCNDSYVKLSNLQEVLSEKVYILFFSRTKQRPVPADTAFASNGVKSQECNGSDTSKSQKLAHSSKAVCTKQSDHSFGKDNLTRFKVNKVPSSPEANLNSFGNSGTNNFPATVNVKIAVHKSQSNGKNGDVKASISVEKGAKNMSSLDENGVSKSKTVEAIDGENGEAFPSANGNGKTKSAPAESAEAGMPQDGHGRNGVTTGRNSEKDMSSLDRNGVTRICTAEAIDGGNSQAFPFANGNGKTKSALAKSAEAGRPEDGHGRNGVTTGRNGEKDMSSLDGNGVTGSRTVEPIDGENSQPFSLANGNGKTKSAPAKSAEAGMPEDGHGRNGVTTGRNSEKDMSSLDRNGFTKSRTVEAIDGENSQTFPLANGNGKTKSAPAKSAEAGMPKDDHGRNGVTMGRRANRHELRNSGVNCPSDISGSKRKLEDEDSCILFAKDIHSRKKLEVFKEVLGKEASSVLRSCGWKEEVYSSMHSRKKVCSQDARDMASNGNELKKLLITDAKQIFLSQIPEFLKENLINHLRSFSREK